MMKSIVLAGLASVALLTSSATAAELKIDQATIKAGKLVVTGRTAKPNQVVEIVNTGDRTVSLPSRRFSFSLSYLPDDCKLSVKSDTDTLADLVVSGCLQRGKDGKDGRDGKGGKDGKDGKDGVIGKDGKDGFVYGSLSGDGIAFKCWPSDLIGLWFIKDYPAPNSRTIAHIAPDRIAGGNKFNVTEPNNPLKSDKPESSAAARWAEFDTDKIYVLDRETKGRNGVRGNVSPDCRSIVWRSESDGVLNTWER
jgi:hypothetical protein